MGGIDDAIGALRVQANDQAYEILEALGAGKPGAAVRARALWAIARLLCRRFDDPTVEAILEVARRTPTGGDAVYRKFLLVTGPFEELLVTAAAQEVRLRIGDYFLRDEKPEIAMPWLTAALSAAPEDPIAIYLEANCRFALYGERQAVLDMEGVLGRAAADVERAYFVGGRTAAFWFRLGLAHERMKNLEMAAAYLGKAVDLDPNNDTPRLLLGDVFSRLGRFSEAIELLEAIEQHAEGYPYAARLRAFALYHLGETEKALALLREVAEIDPLGAITFLEMGRIYLAQSDLERAEAALARGFRSNPELPGLKSAIVALERHLGRHMDADAGLPPPKEFAIPDEFAPRLDDPSLLHKRTSFRTAFASFLRVVQTLIVRDILVIYKHSGMGYLWALAQPLVYIGTIALVYTATGRQAPLRTSTVAYLAAGIVPYVTFYVRLETAVAGAVRSNVNLFYFRDVTPLALISAAIVREFLTALVVFVIIVGGIALYDDSVTIRDPLTILLALTGIALLGTIVGAIFGLGELAIPSLQLAEVAVARVMFFFSGALFYANLIPAEERKWALLNPMLHLIEFVRDGYFSNYTSRYANWQYPMEFIVFGLAFIMLLLHRTRRYMVAE